MRMRVLATVVWASEKMKHVEASDMHAATVNTGSPPSRHCAPIHRPRTACRTTARKSAANELRQRLVVQGSVLTRRTMSPPLLQQSAAAATKRAPRRADSALSERDVTRVRDEDRSARREAWNDLAAMAPVDAEVGIGRQENRICRRLAHSDETRVGEAHRDVGILLHETQNTIEFITEIERRDDDTTTQHRAQGRPAPAAQEVESLRERGVAGSPGRGQPWSVGHGPGVESVPTTQECDDEPGVNENACGHTPSPS